VCRSKSPVAGVARQPAYSPFAAITLGDQPRIIDDERDSVRGNVLAASDGDFLQPARDARSDVDTGALGFALDQERLGAYRYPIAKKMIPVMIARGFGLGLRRAVSALDPVAARASVEGCAVDLGFRPSFLIRWGLKRNRTRARLIRFRGEFVDSSSLGGVTLFWSVIRQPHGGSAEIWYSLEEVAETI
jgi:hypothetical protein